MYLSFVEGMVFGQSIEDFIYLALEPAACKSTFSEGFYPIASSGRGVKIYGAVLGGSLIGVTFAETGDVFLYFI